MPKKPSTGFIVILGIAALVFAAAMLQPRQLASAWWKVKFFFLERYREFQIGQNLKTIDRLVENAPRVEIPAGAPLNLLLVSIDTCRSDRLGCYGCPDPTTPNIDSLAAKGARFSSVVCSAPVTLPSHATIMTSLYPPTHGVRDNGSFRLDESFLTLAEILKQNGFATGAVVGSFVLDHRFGLGQGFDYYHDTFRKPGSYRFLHSRWQGHKVDIFESAADEVTLEALRWLSANREKRFFLFVHYYDPHEPYTPPRAYRDKFPSSPYNGEVSFVDGCLSRLFRYLEKTGLSGDTLISITGDHGESLGEHGYTGHADVVYDEVLLVPWVIADPREKMPGHVIARQVSSVDIMPTLLDLLSLPIPDGLQGRSRLPLLSGEIGGGEEISYSETLFPFLRGGQDEIYCLRTPRWKLIRRIAGNGRQTESFFDLASPGDENADVSSRYPEEAGFLSRRLDEYRKLEPEKRFQRMIGVEDDTRKKLKALGYL